MKLRGSVLAVVLTAWATVASATPINLSATEPNLLGTGGILDSLYGLSNLSQVADEADQVWTNLGSVTATTVAKYSGFSQTFGYFDTTSNFVPLFTSSSNTTTSGSFSSLASGSAFSFGLDPSGSPLWNSVAPSNPGGLDHLVAWQVLFGPSAGNFVLAWEDLNLGDQDYNDLVLEIAGAGLLVPGTPSSGPGDVPQSVPEPATLVLVGLGLASVLGRSTRKRSNPRS